MLQLFRQNFAFTFFTAILFIALCSLGNWQLNRLLQKNSLIAKVNNQMNSEPQKLSRHNLDDFNKIFVKGQFIANRNIFLYAKKSASPEKNGYYLLGIFESIDKQRFLVSRGWIPASMKDQINTPPLAQETITAFVMPGEKKPPFVPANDHEKNIWFTIDLLEAEELYSVNPNKYLLQINSETLPSGASQLSGNNLNKIRNDHLEYAITWYSLAVILLIIYCLNMRKKYLAKLRK